MEMTIEEDRDDCLSEAELGIPKIITSSNPVELMLISSPSNARSMYMPNYYLYLAGYMEKCGISVTIVDPHLSTVKQNVEYILDQVKHQNPKFIGLACFVTDYDFISDLALKIKDISNAPILVGNAQPSISPEDFLYEGSPFDIVAKGEAEETVREIINSSGDIDSLMKVKGIAFFDGKSVVTTEKRPLMDLADLGRPAYHLMDMDWYTQPGKYTIRRLAARCVVVYTGRGCPFDCNFCASNVVWNTNDKSLGNNVTRMRPLDVVMDELEILQNKYGFDFFYIGDDTFGLVDRVIVDFCNEYKRRGLKMLWGAETRAPCIKNPETVKLLKEAGCIQLDFGVESGSPKILELVQKKIKVEHIHTAFDLCHQYGIRTFANMLLNMPQENEEDLRMSHELLERIRPSYTSIGLTQPYPGTPLYDEMPLEIDKSEYHLLNRITPVDKFRFAEHNHDLSQMLFEWQVKYKQFPFFDSSMYAADWTYWKHILKSRYRLHYLWFFIKDMSWTFLHSIYIRSPLREFKTRHKSENMIGLGFDLWGAFRDILAVKIRKQFTKEL
jgi:anaerobic magnesium-protoporphyrin IX monomethyl ester cyclase